MVRAFTKLVKQKKVGEIYNLGAGNPQTINYLVKLLKGPVKKYSKKAWRTRSNMG